MQKLCLKQQTWMVSMMRTPSVIRMLTFSTICAIKMWLQRISQWWTWLPSHCAKKTIFQVRLDELYYFLKYLCILQFLLTKLLLQLLYSTWTNLEILQKPLLVRGLALWLDLRVSNNDLKGMWLVMNLQMVNKLQY